MVERCLFAQCKAVFSGAPPNADVGCARLRGGGAFLSFFFFFLLLLLLLL